MVFHKHPLYTPKKETLPQILYEIADPPKKLRARGSLPKKSFRFLAVVGSRKYSSYGKDACEYLIEGLAGQNVVIVSGLALGIDAIAHLSALKVGLPTIAVPGSGLNESVLYPRSNVSLAHHILDAGGALLSPFDDDWRPRPESFPERNRIMAGMSRATLVIEAGEKSGTLITSRLALEYNRDVGVVPGNIFSPAVKGSNKLIRQGAFPITDISDLFELLDLKPLKISDTSTPPPDLSRDEIRIFETLDEPKTKDELLEILSLPAQEVNIILSKMEINGLLTERMGKIERL